MYRLLTPPWYCRLQWKTFEPTRDRHQEWRIDSRNLMRWYLKHGQCCRRATRVVIMTLVSLTLVAVATCLFGIPPTPCRGPTCYGTYLMVCGLLLTSLIFLLSFAIDAIGLGLRVVSPLIEYYTVWPTGNHEESVPDSRPTAPPPAAANDAAKIIPTNEESTPSPTAADSDAETAPPGEAGTPPPAAADSDAEAAPPSEASTPPPTEEESCYVDQRMWAEWGDVQFIARLTEGIGKLLYFPAILLVTMIAGRFWYFDHWTFPPTVIVIYVVLTGNIVVCGGSLQIAARRARGKALDTLNGMLNRERMKASPDKGTQDRLQYLIAEINGLRTGAFRPATENPILHFMLLPSGSVGFLAALTYFLPG